MTEVMPQFI
ncbi:Protein of unknown function [Lactobacillus delbrueckii subsp. bulgaricus]|nr:Protein of unknown function [Lactobacillus delbrueckii subsp. bulgaricus]